VAEAVVGRPATPVSVAGVARRTTRRTVVRTSAYVAALPHGCTTVTINGMGLWGRAVPNSSPSSARRRHALAVAFRATEGT
jgi:hypothetical protein